MNDIKFEVATEIDLTYRNKKKIKKRKGSN